MKNSRSTNQKVISNSIIYSASGLLIKCFGMVLLPLYTAYLTTADYGITSIVNSFLSTMSFVVAFSLYSAILRFYVDLKDDSEKLKRFYGTMVVFVFLSGIVMGLVLSCFHTLLEKYVFAGINFYPIIFVCLISLVFNCQHTIYENILRSQQKAGKYSLLSIVYFFLTVGLNIAFVVYFKMGALGVVLATAIAGALYTIYFWADMFLGGHIKFCLDGKLLKEALKYSVPIMPHDLSTHIATLVSKVLIGTAAELSSLGVFSVATQFGYMSDTIQTYVNNAYGPWLYEKLNQQDEGYKQSIRSVVKMLCSVIGLFFVGISLFAQDYIVLFVEKSYVTAWTYVPLIVLVFAIKTIYYFYVNILFYYKKASKKLFIATLTGSVLNILFSAFLIPLWGVYGSILADALSMLVRVVIVVMMSTKFENIGLRIRDFVVNFAVVVLFIFGGLAFSYYKYQTTFSILNFGYKVAIVLVYIVYMYCAHKKEIDNYIRNIKNKLIKKKD